MTVGHGPIVPGYDKPHPLFWTSLLAIQEHARQARADAIAWATTTPSLAALRFADALAMEDILRGRTGGLLPGP